LGEGGTFRISRAGRCRQAQRRDAPEQRGKREYGSAQEAGGGGVRSAHASRIRTLRLTRKVSEGGSQPQSRAQSPPAKPTDARQRAPHPLERAPMNVQTASGQDHMLSKAETLIEALPYFQRYAGRSFVVKYGGHAMGDPDAARDFARDIVLLKA